VLRPPPVTHFSHLVARNCAPPWPRRPHTVAISVFRRSSSRIRLTFFALASEKVDGHASRQRGERENTFTRPIKGRSRAHPAGGGGGGGRARADDCRGSPTLALATVEPRKFSHISGGRERERSATVMKRPINDESLSLALQRRRRRRPAGRRLARACERPVKRPRPAKDDARARKNYFSLQRSQASRGRNRQFGARRPQFNQRNVAITIKSIIISISLHRYNTVLAGAI